MKRINTIILSIIFTANALYASPLSFLSNNNAYTIGDVGRPIQDLRSFAKPAQMFRITDGPIGATDKEGNRLYYSKNGKLSMSISKEGEVTFSLGNASITKDSAGKTTSIKRNIAGTNRSEITNEFGEIVSYQETTAGGKLKATYDSEGNLTKTYNYDSKFNKLLVSITNELTQGKTIFNDNGLPSHEIDYEGNIMVTYNYDDKNRLTTKVDSHGNTTLFDEHGKMTETVDKENIVLYRYNYKYDEKGNAILESSYDPTTMQTTFYDEQGRQMSTKNYAGAEVMEWIWSGSKLVACHNHENGITEWFGVDGRSLYQSFQDELISKNIYYLGKLIGTWERRTNQVTIYHNERRELTLQLGDFGHVVNKEKEDGSVGLVDIVEAEIPIEPSAEDILKWIELGLLDNKYAIAPSN